MYIFIEFGVYLLDIIWNKWLLKCCLFKIDVSWFVYLYKVNVFGDFFKSGYVGWDI